MEIKGNIGDNVYVKAQIRSVNITDKGTRYRVVTGVGYLDLTEDSIEFLDNDEPKADPKEEPQVEPKAEPQEEPKEEPKEETKNKRTMLTQDGRFVHSKWLRDTIDKSGLSQKAFCDKLNAWLNDRHGEGKYLDIKKYHAPDLSNYMNGNVYMSEYKLHVIMEFADGLDKETAVKEPKMETTEKIRKATVESTMAKLRKMRGEK